MQSLNEEPKYFQCTTATGAVIAALIRIQFTKIHKKLQTERKILFFFLQCRAATGAVVAALIKEAQLEMEFAKMRGGW